MTVEIPPRDALRLQLAAIAGNEPTSSYIEIRAKRCSGGMGQDWIPVSELDRAQRSVTNRGRMNDCYIGVTPRTVRKGTADAIERVWCLWADCDGLDALQRLSACRPLPSIVIRSGSKNSAHAYWPLSHHVEPAYAQRGNRRLALALGADRNATDPARILRPAGTLNFKHGDPRPVICTRLEVDVFTFSQVVGHLADDRAYIQTPRSMNERPSGDLPRVLDGLARTVTEATVGNRNAAVFWAACRLRERLDAGELHPEARDVLRQAALDAGLSETEVERTLDSALNTSRQAA